MRRGNMIMIGIGLIVLALNGAVTAGAIGWLDQRTTLTEELEFVRGVRPGFGFSEATESVLTLASSATAQRVVLQIAPNLNSDPTVQDAEANLAEQRLEAVHFALREAGFDQLELPVELRLLEPQQDAPASVTVLVERY